MQNTKPVNTLKLGAVVMTRGVAALAEECRLNLLQFLRRHALGDWGDLEKEDKVSNEEALKNGGRVFSAYNLTGTSEPRLWVITEADRSSTTLLLPSEY